LSDQDFDIIVIGVVPGGQPIGAASTGMMSGRRTLVAGSSEQPEPPLSIPVVSKCRSLLIVIVC